MFLIGPALGFIEVIIGVIAALIGLITAVLFVIMKLPPAHPVRVLFTALLLRLGVSLGGAVMAAPMTAIPGIGEVGDAAVALGVLYFWLTFFQKIYEHLKEFHRQPDTTAGHEPMTIIVPAKSNGGLKL